MKKWPRISMRMLPSLWESNRRLAMRKRQSSFYEKLTVEFLWESDRRTRYAKMTVEFLWESDHRIYMWESDRRLAMRIEFSMRKWPSRFRYEKVTIQFLRKWWKVTVNSLCENDRREFLWEKVTIEFIWESDRRLAMRKGSSSSYEIAAL